MDLHKEFLWEVLPGNRDLWESRGTEKEDPKGCFPLLLGLNPKQLILPACLTDFHYTNQLWDTPKEIFWNKWMTQEYIVCHPVPLLVNVSYRTTQIVVYNTRDPMLQMQGFQADIMCAACPAREYCWPHGSWLWSYVPPYSIFQSFDSMIMKKRRRT